jgi:hypothetical protein
MAGGPQYYDSTGVPVSQVICGSPITFDVPGYKSVWLDQTHNAGAGYSGVFPLPMPPYTPNCSTEVGIYANQVYTVGPQGQRGTPIGSNTFTVMPVSAGGPPPTTTPKLPFTCPPGFYVTADAQSGLPACATNPGTFVPSGTSTGPQAIDVPQQTPVIVSQPPNVNITTPAAAGLPPIAWLLGAGLVAYLLSKSKG